VSYNNHYKYLEREPGLERDPPLERGDYVVPKKPFEEYVPESERSIERIDDPHRFRTLEELADQQREELEEWWDTLGTTYD